MAKSQTNGRKRKSRVSASLMLRLDAESKACLVDAAGLRHISVSDYVREIVVPQARKELLAARDRTIVLTPQEQLAFWEALNRPVVLTPAQRRLGALMRGEE